METVRAYYEYPSTQAAIFPVRTANLVPQTKSKRSWGKILKISRKGRETSPSVLSTTTTVYSPGFNVSQGSEYPIPGYSYAFHHDHFITSTPTKETGRIYPTTQRTKSFNYNTTFGRSSFNPCADLLSSHSNGTVKNTIRYTDWFGSVVARKPKALRPGLPLNKSAAILPGENGVPMVPSWDNFIGIQTSQTAVELPSFLPIYSCRNICMCPDQFFSTRSKKKKCKKCGRKYGTLKHGTALGTVTRIRPVIPLNCYQPPSLWTWCPSTNGGYNQQLTVASQHKYQRVDGGEDTDYSPPPSPETVRSNGSGSTLKALPPPPTAPLPSIPAAPPRSSFGMNLPTSDVGRETAYSEKSGVSVISIGESDPPLTPTPKSLNDRTSDDKILIYTDAIQKVVIKNTFENMESTEEKNPRPSRGKSSPSRMNRDPKEGRPPLLFGAPQTEASSNNRPTSRSRNHVEKSLSSCSNQNRKKPKDREETKDDSEVIPKRDNAKVLSIAGQRILFDRKVSGGRTSNACQLERKDGDTVAAIGEWETFNVAEEGADEEVNRTSCYFKPIDHKWNIRDTIHEEEEDEGDVGGNEDNNSTESGSDSLSPDFKPDDADKDTSSSAGSPTRDEGFRPTLSELLQVKSILKRPNSLDTSSETDSDFYIPPILECKQTLRKKKCVQFRPSHQVNLVEDVSNTKGRKVSSIKKRPIVGSSPDGGMERKANEGSLELGNSGKGFGDKYCDSWNSIGVGDEEENGDFNRGLREETPRNKELDEFSSGIRRSRRQRDPFEMSVPSSLVESLGLCQAASDPLKEKRSIVVVPPRKKSSSPVRPSVPPPPPPPPVFSSSFPHSRFSISSSLSSSPPPVPSSSPPPLEDEESSSPTQARITAPQRPPLAPSLLQITPSAVDFSNHHVCDTLPASKTSSVFATDEETPTATIRGRVKASNPSNLSSFLSLGGSENPPLKKGITGSSAYRSSFLVEDAEGHYSDHIYEELPSLPSSPATSNTPSPEWSMFDGASKYQILEFLKDARSRVNIAETDDVSHSNILSERLESAGLEDDGIESQEMSVLPSRYMDERSSNRSSNSESSENSGLLRSDKERLAAAEIERTDSGVGSETSKPTVTIRHHSRGKDTSSSTSPGHCFKEGDMPPCDDCDSPVEAKVTNSGLMYAPLVCRRCGRRRQERKEILAEIMETETKYGRDLRVTMDQFNRPMRVAGLLSKSQIDRIFLNMEDLIEHNRNFSLQLKDAYEIALDQGDEDLLTVNVAKLFFNADSMLHAFQNYCVSQGGASILLQNLEKEKELLRIFLKVSQMENTLLRRMNLHSFLMVPVQRVTKYPLLLARLYKATAPSHSSREDCRRAREKIELYLQYINNETKEASPTKLWRRISMSVGSSPPSRLPPTIPDYDTSRKLRMLAMEVLDWNTDEAALIREGRLLCLPPESNNWTRRGRSFKMAAVRMVLVTLGKPRLTLEEAIPEDGLITQRDLGIREAAVLAFKDHRLTRTALMRDPWLLSRVVVTWDAEGENECFELTDLVTKETFIFKDRESVGTEEWFRSIQFHALSVGRWRRRRPALANIMINGARRQ